MTAPWPTAKRILIIFILFWGALAALVRLATPLLEHAREPLSNWLSEQSGQPVNIGQLSADWYGLGPRLRLRQVSIGDPATPVLLSEVLFELKPGGLFSGSPSDALRITLRDLDLKLRREANGQVHVIGLPFRAATASDSDQLPVLPAQLRLLGTRLHWQDLRVQAQPLIIEDLHLDLRRDGQSLNLSARLDSNFGRARFVADIEGFLQHTNWSGRSYLQVQDMNLAKLLSAYLPKHYRIDSGRLDLELWQQWQEALPVDTRGKLALNQARLSGQGEAAHSVNFNRISGDFQFDRIDNQQWLLQVSQVNVEGHGPAWPQGRIAIRRQHTDQQSTVDAAIEHLLIEDLAQLLLVRAPSPRIHQAISQMQPQGQIQQLRLQLHPESDRWAASAGFEGINIDAWGNIPGIRGLTGEVAATPLHTSLGLQTSDAPLDYTSLFRNPLHIEQLVGDIHLTRQQNGWTLLSDELHLDTPDMRTRTRLSLDLPSGQPPYLELISEVRDGKVSATSKYLPAAIMTDELVSWLDTALSEGKLESATALLKGPLDTFPYHKQRNGVFEVVATTRATPLHYREGWPPLQDLDAVLSFHEYSMDIGLLKGRIYDSPVQHLEARIDNLWPTSPLRITGHIAGPLKDQVAVLKEDALSEKFGHIAEALVVQGQAELTLDFSVPLMTGIGEYALNGELLFKDAQLQLPDWNLQIEEIQGALAITLDDLRADGITGKAFGAPVQVSVTPQPDSSTRVSAELHLERNAIAKQLPDLPLHLAAGSADFRIDLDIPGVSAGPGAPTWLSVNSDLQGMRLDLPQPLGKDPAEKRQLSVRLPVAGDPQANTIEYDGKLSAAFRSDWKAADIRYRRGQAVAPQSDGYSIKANLEQLRLTEWQALADGIGGATQASTGWVADIQTDRLVFGELALDRAGLAIESTPKSISGGILSEQLAGNFDYPKTTGQPVQVRLQKAHLSFDATAEDSPQAPEPANEPDPRELPALQLSCEDLRLNKAELGKAQVLTEPGPLGMRIQQLQFDGPNGQLQANGSWIWLDKAQHTELSGSFNSEDLGQLLHRLGYSRNMRNAPGKASFNLNWPGHPGQAHKASIAGKVDLEIGAGRLAELDPGITRVIGLLSVDALARRLKLDFGDLTKKGYSFDSISGSFRFEGGNAHTNDLLIDGPSGRIEVGGRIGLVDRDFDQLVNVTPKLDATLPIASTIAGGPVAGVAALVAQSLMADEVDKLNRFEYTVRGTWDKPELIPLDSGGGLSRLVNKLSGKKTESKTEQQKELIKRPEQEKPGPIKRLLNVLPGKAQQDPAPVENHSE